MTFFNATSNVSLDSKTIVIPVVSTANIGQLAVDILIASLNLVRIGVFDPQYFVPVVGAREDGQPGITTPYELFGRPDLAFVVIQQRSPVLKDKKTVFIEALLEFIKGSNFSAVLLLSGVNQLHRTDSQMLAPTFQICPTKTHHLVGTPLNGLSELPIPLYKFSLQSNSNPNPDRIPASSSSIPFIPGGGLTRRILSSIPENWDIPVVSLVHFVMEGDNRADASLLSGVVVKVLGLEISQWKQPVSWQVGLFGTPHDQSLYG